ncbi:MAG: WD40/YVTN/BNR-like repeat-containing protein [Woeseiaceae bacterium]
MKSRLQTCSRIMIAVLTVGVLSISTAGATDTVNPALYDGLKWREIGPWRGGRVTAVTGVPGNDRLYYMGATGGGVWKTENAGISWQNISDNDFNVGTIGAIAVADSDINIVYVGTGEAPIRGVTTSHGDGMYKSMDAGATWEHIGLPAAGQIARIIVHPKDPDLVYVAVQGQIWGPSDERGVYRSTDGGETWEAILQVDNETGATDLSMDPSNPRIIYASMWEHGRTPWFIKSGGTAGGLFKTTDGGDTWEKIVGRTTGNDRQNRHRRFCKQSEPGIRHCGSGARRRWSVAQR